MKTKCDSCRKAVTKTKGKKKHVILLGTVTVEIGVMSIDDNPKSGMQGSRVVKREVMRFCNACGSVVVDSIREKCR